MHAARLLTQSRKGKRPKTSKALPGVLESFHCHLRRSAVFALLWKGDDNYKTKPKRNVLEYLNALQQSLQCGPSLQIMQHCLKPSFSRKPSLLLRLKVWFTTRVTVVNMTSMISIEAFDDERPIHASIRMFGDVFLITGSWFQHTSYVRLQK
jgi:hypothetical protein